MRRTIALTLALLLTVGALLPVAAAGWRQRGSYEPDTLQDWSDGMMYREPDQERTGFNVYFNVFGRISRFTQYSPNVALTGSTMQPPGTTTFTGFLGIWKDCNQDGYIGMSEYGLLEYRVELLLDNSICPVTPHDAAKPYPFNDGGWIREFLFIGPSFRDGGKGAQSQNPTLYISDGTRIWGDWNLPGQPPRFVCPLGGSNLDIRTTGGMLEFADCTNGYGFMDTLNGLEESTGLPVGGWNKEAPEQSDNTLNQKNPAYTLLWGESEDGGVFAKDTETEKRPRAFTVFDCDSGEARPGVGDPSGSVYEPLNETYNVAYSRATGGDGSCKPQSGERELLYPRVTSTGDSTNPFKGRDTVDHTFEFSFGSRRMVPGAVPVGPYAPTDLGLGVERDDGPVGPAWRTNPQILTGPQVRSGFGPANANYMTFYARLGQRALDELQAPSETPRVYGDEACPSGIGSGMGKSAAGWQCDPQFWYDYCAAQSPPILSTECYAVGETYHLRDIDCWDGRVARGTPVYASTVPLSAAGGCALDPEQDNLAATLLD